MLSSVPMNPPALNPAPRSHLALLAALAALWALYGLTGRDAWGPEEALALGHVLDWLDSGHAHAAPLPLHTFAAGLAAKLFGPWLDAQDAARLASGIHALAALAFTGLAARALYGPGHGAAAALLLMGAFGLMLRAHALLPDTLQLAAYAALLYGAALARRAPPAGGLVLGLALFALALLRGVPDLAFGLAIAALPLASRDWRTPAYRRALRLGAGLAALLLAAWLAWLAAQGGLAAWLAGHGAAGLAPVHDPGRLASLLAWSAWPLWPLALWAVWHEHRRLARATDLHLPLAACAVLAYAALVPGFTRDGNAVPLLLPLALLAAYAIGHLRRGAAHAFYWFGVLTFLFFILVFWVYYAAMEWGWPAGLAEHLARMTPGYRPGSVPGRDVALAIAATVAWLAAIPLFPRARLRPALVWATGMTLAWVLFISLFRPWGEAGWAWRPVLEELDRQLPAGACIEVRAEPPTLVMLRHHLGQRLAREGQRCDWSLVQGTRSETRMPDGDYEIVWLGQRPRFKDEVLRLYKSAPHGGTASPSPAGGTSPKGAGRHEVAVRSAAMDGPKAHRGQG